MSDDRLQEAIDRLGWTNQNDQEAYNDALWNALKVVRDEIVKLRRDQEATND